jgi:type II secretory pathway component GspD/PulD (secretin)
MRADDENFRDITAAFGNFQNLGTQQPALSGTVPDAATLAALSTLGTKNWIFKDGSWQTVSGMIGVNALLTEKQFQKILRYMDGRKGVDLLSAPRVTTLSGNRAVIEVVREFRYADDFELDPHHGGIWTPDHFATQNTGLTLDVTPKFETSGALSNTIDLDLNPEFADFVAFLPEKSGGKIKPGPMHPSKGYWRPIFSFTRGKTELNVLPDQTVMLAGMKVDRNYNGQPVDASRSVLLMFVTPSIIAPEGIPVTGAKPPYARPFPGKLGFVTSPFTGGYVDVRGFPKDAQVKDPYTGKIFLVP